ncbi:MAG: hypothetical protein ACI4L6_03805 [Candidatus Onthoplasma sp.]
MIKTLELKIEVIKETDKKLNDLKNSDLSQKEYKKLYKSIQKEAKKKIKQIDKEYPIEKEIEKFLNDKKS